jgi:hypothetical protein
MACRWAGVRAGGWTDRYNETNKRSSRIMQPRLKNQSVQGAVLYVTVTYLLTYLLTDLLDAAEF